ncbi:MAG: GNAT family N-acetyltransferase [Pseudomonas sp.]|uniref:GNAT family N-acetyltransferase n=1 Tax=Pseudomonas sp. TaxID=306 RepID=UPI003393240D
MEPLQLIEANAADAAWAARLTEANMAVYYRRNGLHWNPPAFTVQWAHCENWRVQCGDRAAGFVSLDSDGQFLYLRDLQLIDSCQGRGLGAQILCWALQIAARRRLAGARLKVFADNPAQRLYRRHGFVEVGEEGALLRLEHRFAPKE